MSMSKKRAHRRRPPVPSSASRAVGTLTNESGRRTHRLTASEIVAKEAPKETPKEVVTTAPKAKPSDELFASELKRRAQAAQAVQGPQDEETTPVTPVPAVRVSPETLESREPLVEASNERDDTSIPPVLVEAKPEVTDDHADRFFAEGDSQASMRIAMVTEEHEEEANPELKWRLSPAVQARRSRYTKIAQRVVGAFALLALVGLGKAALTHAPSADLPLKALANAAAEPLAHADESKPAPKQEEPTVVATAEDPKPEANAEAKPEEAKADPAAVAPAADPAAAPAVDPSADPKADKKAAQQAIERGDNKTAVEMGERVLAADPTDAEVWLIVGAAYQAMGQNGKAHEAFAECVKQGKRGPIGECRALR
jgi:hypothetical protein